PTAPPSFPYTTLFRSVEPGSRHHRLHVRRHGAKRGVVVGECALQLAPISKRVPAIGVGRREVHTGEPAGVDRFRAVLHLEIRIRDRKSTRLNSSHEWN